MKFCKTLWMKSYIAFSALKLCSLHYKQGFFAVLAFSTLGSFKYHMINLVKPPVDRVLKGDRHCFSVSVFLVRDILSDNPVYCPQEI